VRLALTNDEGVNYTAYDTETDGATPLTIVAISEDGMSMTLSDSLTGLIADLDGGGYELSSIARLASKGVWTGEAVFTADLSDPLLPVYRMTRTDGSAGLATASWKASASASPAAPMPAITRSRSSAGE